MKNVLLVGGSGFIGRNIIEYFENSDKYKIYAPGSKELDCIDEQRVVAFLRKNKINIVLHSAVYGDGIDKNKDGSKILEYNLKMYYNFAIHNDLFDVMYYFGSGAEYDKGFPIHMADESEIGKTLPKDPYGLMKFIVGKDIEKKDNIYNLRLFGIFGKYEYWPVKFISNICCKAIMGVPLSVRQNVYFDYLYIDDFLHILELIMNKGRLQYHSYNVVSGKPIDLLSICDIVNNISGGSAEVFVCREGLANEYTASNNRLMREFPQIKFTEIKDSIKRLYAWYLSERDHIDLMKLLY